MSQQPMGYFQRLFGVRPVVTSEPSVITPITELSTAPNLNGADFSDVFVKSTYEKIMHSVADRTVMPAGVTKDEFNLTAYDSYSPFKRGLVSLLVDGMVSRSHRYFDVIKTSRGDFVFVENFDPRKDAKGNLTDPNVLELDFREFAEGDILKLLFEISENIAQAASNGTAMSLAPLVKLHKLSEMIDSQTNLEPLREQLNQLNESITHGRAGVIDAESDIVFTGYDPQPAVEAQGIIAALVSAITGVPQTVLFGESVGGLGDMSVSEQKRLDAALRRYFHSIMSGCLYVVWGKVFQYATPIIDTPNLVALFNFIETTSLLTEEGRRKLLLENTSLVEEDIDVSEANLNEAQDQLESGLTQR